MLKRAANIFGIAFIGAGILGFIPGVTVDGHLFGIFAVNATHNIVHILSGAVALYAAYQSERAAMLYFQIFGVVYLLVTVVGLFAGNSPLLGIMAHNHADVVLHVIISAAALYLGFAPRVRRTAGHVSGAHPH
jgi:hypothetical protein